MWTLAIIYVVIGSIVTILGMIVRLHQRMDRTSKYLYVKLEKWDNTDNDPAETTVDFVSLNELLLHFVLGVLVWPIILFMYSVLKWEQDWK